MRSFFTTTLPGSATQEMVRAIKKKLPNMQVVALSPMAAIAEGLADHVVNSHKPEELLHLLQSLFGDARKVNGAGKQLPGDANSGD